MGSAPLSISIGTVGRSPTALPSLQLPRDLFSRDDVETEWWYYHGHLEGAGRHFGFHLAFFRRRTGQVRVGRYLQIGSADSHTRFAHFALADISRRQFHYGQRRSHYGGAGAAADRFEVWSGDWSARERDDCHELSAQIRGASLDITLEPRKPAIGHGRNGFFPKLDGGRSLYFSFPRMEVNGTLTINGETLSVGGHAWMDREFGQLGFCDRLRGWDWFAIQLDDNRELLIYRLRDGLHRQTTHSMATLIDRDHTVRQLGADDFELAPLGAWQSPQSGNVYPVSWRVSVPSLAAELTIDPYMKCHEMDTRGSTNLIYWEGPARVRGMLGGASARGRCYVELVGYESVPERIGLFDFANNGLSFTGWILNELRLRMFGSGITVHDSD
jgi:predicted secreted hydrolase